MKNLIALSIWLISSLAVAAPTVSYTLSGGSESRKLIFVNNPEEIRAEAGACDLSDNLTVGGTYCGVVVHRITNATGILQ